VKKLEFIVNDGVLNLESNIMNQKEILHLEEEFKNYKKIYPRDE
jgi:hypothetical protein